MPNHRTKARLQRDKAKTRYARRGNKDITSAEERCIDARTYWSRRDSASSTPNRRLHLDTVYYKSPNFEAFYDRGAKDYFVRVRALNTSTDIVSASQGERDIQINYRDGSSKRVELFVYEVWEKSETKELAELFNLCNSDRKGDGHTNV